MIRPSELGKKKERYDVLEESNLHFSYPLELDTNGVQDNSETVDKTNTG